MKPPTLTPLTLRPRSRARPKAAPPRGLQRGGSRASAVIDGRGNEWPRSCRPWLALGAEAELESESESESGSGRRFLSEEHQADVPGKAQEMLTETLHTLHAFWCAPAPPPRSRPPWLPYLSSLLTPRPRALHHAQIPRQFNLPVTFPPSMTSMALPATSEQSAHASSPALVYNYHRGIIK